MFDIDAATERARSRRTTYRALAERRRLQTARRREQRATGRRAG
jgi:hypothetical protein